MQYELYTIYYIVKMIKNCYYLFENFMLLQFLFQHLYYKMKSHIILDI